READLATFAVGLVSVFAIRTVVVPPSIDSLTRVDYLLAFSVIVGLLVSIELSFTRHRTTSAPPPALPVSSEGPPPSEGTSRGRRHTRMLMAAVALTGVAHLTARAMRSAYGAATAKTRRR